MHNIMSQVIQDMGCSVDSYRQLLK